MDKKTFIVSTAYKDIRLDKALLSLMPDLSFSEVQKLLRKKYIRLNNKKAKADMRLQIKDEITYPAFLLDKKTPTLKALDSKLESFINAHLLYEDAYFLAFNKPQGLATQGGSKIKQSLDKMLKDYYEATNPTIKPCLIHRLDKETSGIILVAKNTHSASKFAALFKHDQDNHQNKKAIEKYYIACAHGKFPQKTITLTTPLLKKTTNKLEQITPSREGQSAKTHLKLLKQNQKKCYLLAIPETGRKHQIRAHLASIGHPILGDPKYNKNLLLSQTHPSPFDAQFSDDHKNLMLHAYRLCFLHPFTQKKLNLTAPLPEHLKEATPYLKEVK